jgi:calcineurin-like phosphoesterase family protein
MRKHPEKYSNIEIYNYLEISDQIKDQTYRLILFHYPLAEWNGFFRNSIHLYGHIHNSVNETKIIMDKIPNAYNVGADVQGFIPRTLKEIIK